MELYLDSVDFKEIEAALDYGFIKGLTTTPTFMHRHGITDIDGAIVKLSKMVPELQVEALGDTPDADRRRGRAASWAWRSSAPPVFKVPISNEGVKGCQRLRATRLQGQRAPHLYVESGVHGDGGRRLVHLPARRAACRIKVTTRSSCSSNASTSSTATATTAR